MTDAGGTATVYLPTKRVSELKPEDMTPLEYIDGHDLFLKGELNYLAGAGAVGKTTVALQLAAAVGLSTNTHPGDVYWLGRPVKLRGPVMFISAEDSVGVLQRKLLEVCADDATELADLSNVHIHDISDLEDKALLGGNGRGKRVFTTPLFRAFENSVKFHKPVLIVVDNRAQTVDAEEMERRVAVAVGNRFRAIAKRHGVTIILLVHPSLSGMKDGRSGSTSWNNTGRNTVLMCMPDDDKEDDGSEDDGKRQLRVTKSNYGPMGRRINLQWTCGVYHCTDKPPRPDANIGAASRAERVFLKLLDSFTRRGIQVTSNRASVKTYAPSVFFETGEREGVSKPALERAMLAHLDRGEIINVGTGPKYRSKTYLARSAKS